MLDLRTRFVHITSQQESIRIEIESSHISSPNVFANAYLRIRSYAFVYIYHGTRLSFRRYIIRCPFFLFFSKRRNNLIVRYQIRILLLDTYKIELSRRAKKTTSGITVGTFNSWKSGELLPFLCHFY